MLDAADRQHFAAKRDLTRHGDVLAHRLPGDGRDQRRRHGDSGRGPVLRNGTFRDMDMEILVLGEARIDAEDVGPASQIGKRGAGRLLHDVSELARENELALTRHQTDLGFEDLAAGLGPGEPRGDADLGLLALLARTELDLAEELADALGVHLDLALLLALHDLTRHLAADLGNLTLQVAHPRFAGIALDQGLQPFFLEADLILLQAVRLGLLGNQESFGDLELLVERITRDLDHLHPVLERRRDRMGDVRGGDEHHLREVVVDIQVMVVEGVVLLRIEHLEQGRRGITSKIHRHLVQLVEKKDGIHLPGLLHHLNDLTRERADVSAAVAADLRLVADAAQGETNEPASGGASNRLGERRLSDPRRSHEADDRRLLLRRQLAHGQELQNALFGFVESVVVLVENLLGTIQVLDLATLLLPRHADQPVDVIARHRGLGGDRRHRFEPLELLLGLLLGLLGKARLLDLLLELGHLVGAVIVAPELLVNRFDLLVEVVLLLRLLHLLLDFDVDPLVDVDLLDLDFQQIMKALNPLVGVEQLEKLLLFRCRHHQMSRELVAEAIGIVRLDGRDQALEGQVMRQLGVLLENREHLGDVFFQYLVRRQVDLVGLEVGKSSAVVLAQIEQSGSPDSFDHHLDVAVRKAQVLYHLGDDAELVHVAARRIVDLRIELRDQEDPPLLRQETALESAHRGFAADDEGGHHVGKHHHVPQRDERQRGSRRLEETCA